MKTTVLKFKITTFCRKPTVNTYLTHLGPFLSNDTQDRKWLRLDMFWLDYPVRKDTSWKSGYVSRLNSPEFVLKKFIDDEIIHFLVPNVSWNRKT